LRPDEILASYQQAFDNPSGSDWLEQYKNSIQKFVKENNLDNFWKKQLLSTIRKSKKIPKQDLLVYSKLLVETEEEVRNSILTDSDIILPPVAVGSVFSNDLNVKTIPCLNGGVIIVFDINLLEFILLTLNIVYDRYFIELHDNNGVLLGSKSHNIKHDYEFLEILMKCLVKQKPFDILKILPSPKIAKLVDMTFHSILIFLMAHEYGHIVNNEVVKSKINNRTNNWIKEYYSDSYGLKKVLELLSKKYGSTIPLLGVQFLFSLFHIVNKACPDLASETDTHPPPEMRRENIKDYIRIAMPNRNFNDLFSIFDNLNSTILSLWEVNSSAFNDNVRDLIMSENIEIDKNSKIYKRLFDT